MSASARQWGCIALSSALLQGAVPTHLEAARIAAADEAAAPAKGGVESKLALLARMLDSDQVAQRIAAAPDPQARAKLDEARAARARAIELMGREHYGAAEQAANDALRLLREAMRAVSASTRDEASLRADYQARLDRVRGFREAYERIQSEKSRARGGVLDEGALDALVAQAGQQARAGHYQEASALLNRASAFLETALTRLRDRETLVHELKFASVEEELRYERDRNQSYVLLLEIVIAEQKVQTGARATVQRAIESNLQARAQADEAARRADTKSALQILETATHALSQALRQAGVPVP